MSVTYTRADPRYTGVYAVRVPLDFCMTNPLHEDKFLYWNNDVKDWYYLSSTERYRGTVIGWIGPLERTRG